MTQKSFCSLSTMRNANRRVALVQGWLTLGFLPSFMWLPRILKCVLLIQFTSLGSIRYFRVRGNDEGNEFVSP